MGALADAVEDREYPFGQCIRGRVVVIGLTRPGEREVEWGVTFPADWDEETFLAYAREQHPGQEVRIIDWPRPSVHPQTWIANPEAFSDYRRGVPR